MPVLASVRTATTLVGAVTILLFLIWTYHRLKRDIERSHEAGFLEHIVEPVAFPTLLAALGRAGVIAMRERNRAGARLLQSYPAS
jgi:hypothetical protein